MTTTDRTNTELLHEALLLLEERAALIDLALAENDTFESRVELLATIHDCMDALRTAWDIVGGATVRVCPDPFQVYDVPGGGVFKVRGGKERKRWDGRRVASALAARVRERLGVERVVMADGEVVDAGAACEEVAQTIAQAAGAHAPSHGWGVTVLRNHQLDPATFCEESIAPRTANIEGRGR